MPNISMNPAATPPFAVLIVDDEDTIRLSIQRILERDGYQLHFARSGEEALAALDSGRIDLLITDHHMPGMTGVDLAERVMQKHPDVMRIILTAEDGFEVVKDAINRAEIYRFLSKPWDDADLRLTVRSACERRRLERENAWQRQIIKRHETILDKLEEQHPGITHVRRDSSGAILLDDMEDA